jgi:hypothetical protein
MRSVFRFKTFGGGFLVGAGCALAISILTVLAFLNRYAAWFVEHSPQRHGHPATETYSGPWGEMDALRIPMVNPSGVPPDVAQRLSSSGWFFQNFSEEQLAAFFNGCSLTTAERTILLDRHGWNVSSNGCTVQPPERILWSLSSKPRGQIYLVLSSNAMNYAQRCPFRFPTNGFEPALALSHLSPRTIAKLKNLTYEDSGTLCFADLRAAKDSLPAHDFEELVETFYQLPIYRLRLRLDSNSDIDALLRYWGCGGRTNLIHPLLTSFARVPGGATLNVSYLLPPFARLHLYTYPMLSSDPTAAQQDCFFTALNFFNDPPNTNFFDHAYTEKVLATEYAPVTGKPAYGDLLLLVDCNGNINHTCVYLAADFVFTKNGVNSSQPWVLMKMEDMLLGYYGRDAQRKVTLLRRKES